MSVSSSRQFADGARDSLPMLVGAAPFGVIFGTLAIAAGLPPWAAQAMSLLVFAGSAQFIAVNLIARHLAHHPGGQPAPRAL